MADRDIQIIIQAIDKTGSAIASIDKNLGWLGGSITKLSVQFSAMSTSIQAAWAGLQKGLGWMEMAAKAQQAEESFRQVAATAGESADEIIAAMKKASAGTIDESDMMQKAVKGITQGLKGDELVRLMETARVAARTTGDDVGTTFDKIVDAVANKTPRALKEMGMVSQEQMSIFEQATRAGVEEITLLDIVIANTMVREAQFGIITDNAAESIQRFNANMKGFKDNLMGTFLTALSALERIIGGIGFGLSYAAVGLFKLLQGMAAIEAWNEGKSSNRGAQAEKEAEKYRVEAETYKLLAAEFGKQAKGDKNTKGYDYEADFATRHKENFLEAAKRSVKGIEDKWRALLQGAKDIKPGKTAKVGATTAKEEEYPIYDTEKGVKAFQEYEQSLTEIKATETEKRLAKTEEWATREYGLLKIAYDNDVIKIKEYSDRIFEIQSAAEEQKLKIKAEAAAEAEALRNKELEEEAKAAQAYKEANGTLWEGLTEGMQNYYDTLKSNFESGRDMANNIANDMESAFTSFFDTTSEKFMNFGDLAKSILNSIYMELVKTLVIKQIMAGISGMFHEGGVVMHQGGLVMHAGGLVGRSGSEGEYVVPRYHMGALAGDERPAILQTGEGVLSRRGMANLGALNSGAGGGGGNLNVNVQIENQTGTPVKAEQSGVRFDGESYIVGVILKNIDGYGALRGAIAGVK